MPKPFGTQTKHVGRDDMKLKAHQVALDDIDARLNAAIAKRIGSHIHPKDKPVLNGGGLGTHPEVSPQPDDKEGHTPAHDAVPGLHGHMPHIADPNDDDPHDDVMKHLMALHPDGKVRHQGR